MNTYVTLQILSGLLVVWVIYRSVKFITRTSNEYYSYAVGVLDQETLLVKSNINNYHFYTDGHPYVWVETNREELCRKIKLCCEVIGSESNGGATGPANVQVRINEEKHAIYVLVSSPGEINKCWPELMHYQEWLESNEPIAERISEYKKRESQNA